MTDMRYEAPETLDAAVTLLGDARGGGAGPAVEDKRQRPVARGFVLLDVGDVKHLGPGFFIRGENDPLGRRLVLQLSITRPEAVFGGSALGCLVLLFLLFLCFVI